MAESVIEIQKKEIVKYMNTHIGITSMDAFDDLGVTRLSARIYDLRKDGYEIVGVDRKMRSRNGRMVKYTEYRLVGEPE